jgi:hypothetical protein
MTEDPRARRSLTDEDIERVRVAIFRGFAATGRAPDWADLADSAGINENAANAAGTELGRRRHIVLETGQDGRQRIVMAHPFAAVPLGFSVMGSSTLWWGGCAWDSFALPHLLPREPDVLVATRCPGCDTPHAWVVNRHRPPAGDQIAHFLVPTAHIWDDVVHTCRHQSLFCSEDCVDRWLIATGHDRGYVMDLATLWRLASHWYEGRLEAGYTRRDPSTAIAYFRDVGLSGPFWGLPG